MRLLPFCLIVMLIPAFGFLACQKESTEEFGTIEKDVIQDNQLAENTVADVLNIADQAGKWGDTFYKSSLEQQAGLLSSCATITHDLSSNPMVLTIDFGTTNCLCNDGKNRRGKIIATHTGPYSEEGTIITLSFENYFVNDRKIMGSKTITHMGDNAALDPWYSLSVNLQIVSANSSDTLYYTATRNRTWIEGRNTLSLLDDVYLLEGTSSGSRTNGTQFITTIIQGLRKEIGCPQFVSGQMQVDRTNKPTLLVDFGTGDCDGEVTVTVNGVQYYLGLNM
jgi:hypothetical protein